MGPDRGLAGPKVAWGQLDLVGVWLKFYGQCMPHLVGGVGLSNGAISNLVSRRALVRNLINL